MRKEVYEGWKELKLILGENLYEKYNNLNNIEELYPYFPKTFLHGDYRPDNTLYIDKNNINKKNKNDKDKTDKTYKNN